MLAAADEGSLLAVPGVHRTLPPRRPSSGPWHCRVLAQAHVDSTRLWRTGPSVHGSHGPLETVHTTLGHTCRTVTPTLQMKKLNLYSSKTFPVAQRVKNLPAMQETRVRSLGQEDPVEKEMATHYSTLAGRIAGTEEPGGLQSMGSQRVRHD